MTYSGLIWAASTLHKIQPPALTTCCLSLLVNSKREAPSQCSPTSGKADTADRLLDDHARRQFVMGSRIARKLRGFRDNSSTTPHYDPLPIRQLMVSSPLVAVIGTALSVNAWLAPSGWRSVDQSFSTPNISMSCLRCQTRSRLLPTKTRNRFTIFSSVRSATLYGLLRPIPSTWEPR